MNTEANATIAPLDTEAINSRRASQSGRQPTESSARLTAVQNAKNPLLEAASPLLRAQADMPEYLEADAIPELRSLLEHEIRIFQKLCEQTNIRRDHMLGASYCLCTALDEAAMQTTWGKAGDSGVEWITTGLASTFHEDRKGGDKIYLLIGRLMTEPKEHIDLLEVIYRILSLGFLGRYRFETDGHRKHDTVRQRLYTEITAQRGPVPAALSPHWEGDTRGRSRPFYDFPVWITAVLLSLILLAMFGYAKYDLMTRSAAVEKQISEISRITPPRAPPALHLKELLKDEIAAGKVSVDEDDHHSAVTFHGDDMFIAGKATVNSSMQPLINKIAAEVVKVPGKVSVIGHTDNTPIRSRTFDSNQALSEERATQVMQLLQDAGVPANRLEVIGKGDAAPIADNKTFQGRAQNRRVEINVAE
ncbi:type VI secretion system protein TssL, long form [Paraburkholderia nemoris]|jgi:type VI secretion system OmpA/MotB family protein|uniref:type VI secretion system protein TssL, long form n=1 Tax=Paraburkholderia nemoris TaxID=2793076 RepID=UPI001B18DFED|nr:type VI secretion system protein TssL, long form [Paraburkholderia nemoris]CAE6746800.1 Peptidoglycan-associated lipoprotein [Paraburkholderia nemoris]